MDITTAWRTKSEFTILQYHLVNFYYEHFYFIFVDFEMKKKNYALFRYNKNRN
jgi:hypothetical protein